MASEKGRYEPSNYRPLRLRCIRGKIVESLVKELDVITSAFLELSGRNSVLRVPVWF